MKVLLKKTGKRIASRPMFSHDHRLFCLFLILCLPFTTGFTSKAGKIIDQSEGMYLFSDHALLQDGNRRIGNAVRTLLENYHPTNSYQKLRILYPYDESIFPPEIAAPTFKWAERNDDIRHWLLIITFEGRHKPLYIVCDEPHWTPQKEIWELIKQYSVKISAPVTILGVKSNPQPEVVSKGVVTITTSQDKVGAPVMFRRVPPNFAHAAKNPEQMQWVLADIASYEDPPVIMTNQRACGSCHTFSQDGRWVGMDMDYKKDKGAYALARVRKDMILTDQDLISWNDFPRSDGLQSTGLYSRISPDGNYVASTVNEIFFLIKIANPYFSQLFFPLQGSLAIYSERTKQIVTLPGADLRNFVQTDPSWSPDGNHLLYSRSPAKHDLFWDLGGQTVFSAAKDADIEQLNRQYPIQFDIYRIAFNHGKGGLAEPLPGASNNGKSNYYPRYSPDGKWIVFTQSKTGLAIQQDSKLFIMGERGGEAKMMRCNLTRMNSWHTWSPNSRWLAFVSKENSPYTELFLTHVDEKGNDSPPIRLERFSKSGYAINVPEFANIPFGGIKNMSLKRK